MELQIQKQQAKNQLQISSTNLSNLNLTKLQVKEERIKIVVQGYENQIRHMDKTDVVNSVSAMVVICAKMYCGLQEDKMMTETIQESTRFIYKNFPMLGVQEIREAFSMAAANYWEGITMFSYYGQFTIAMLGDILSKYVEFRKKVISEILNQAEQAEMAKQKAAKREESNRKAIEIVMNDLENKLIQIQSGVDCEWESWHDVPAFYAEIACNEGFIEDDKEFKKQIWEQAKIIAKQELIEKARDYSNMNEARIAKRKLMQSAEATIEPAKRIYSKLLVWESLKKNVI